MRIRPLPWMLCLMGGLVAAAPALHAQDTDPTGSSNTSITNLLAPGDLEERIASLQNRTDLAPEALQEILTASQQSLALRNDLVRLASEREELLKTTQSASNRLAELTGHLREPVGEATLGLPEDASTSALEQKAAEIEAALSIAQAEQDRLDQEPKRRADRRLTIASLLAEYRKNVVDLERQAVAPTSLEQPEELEQALDLRRTIQQELNLQRVRNLNLELASIEATTELITAQQVLARRKATLLARQLALIKEALHQSRVVESTRAAEEAAQAQQKAEALHLPVVITLAHTNQQLALNRVSVSASLQSTSRKLDETEAELNKLRASHDTVRELVAVARESGVTPDYAIGVALRQEQYSLPSRRSSQSEARQRAEQMTAAKIRLIQLSEQQQAGVDVEARLAEIRTELPPGLSDRQIEEAIEKSRQLLSEERSLLADLSKDYQALGVALAKLSEAQQQWVNEMEQFKLLIAEQVLWFRSANILSLEGARQELGEISRVIGSEVHSGLLPFLRADWHQHPLHYLGAGLLLLLLLGVRLSLARSLRQTCPPNAVQDRLSLKPALLALVATILLTLPIPAALLFLSWRSSAYTGPSPLAEHWSHAFLLSASGVLIIEFFRQSCRTPGLAVAHLRWPEHNARLVRFHFTWLIVAGIPLTVLSDLLEGVFIKGLTNRMLFLVGQVLVLLLGHLLLRSSRGLRFHTHEGGASVQRPMRFQRLYHSLAVFVPLSLMTMSVLGYSFTARQIWLRVADSIQWGLIVLLATLLILHWLTVLRRRMARQKAELKKDALETPQKESLPQPDIWQVYSQSRRMFSALLWIIMAFGLWVIWSDMLPALKKLDRIPIPFLSRTHVPTPGTGASNLPALIPETRPPNAGPAAPAEPLESLDPEGSFLSVGDVIGALIVLLLTLAASRNLPGFVEMVLLSRVHFRQGEGYAIVTILRYLVLLLGIGWALTLIGITWGSVQWLAAAITVGIGFGLQEIFANFASGLILLFERPVRVGDVITVGTVTGKVVKIEMRATTVRNWEQQELVLPNKDLVTGQVINWTLSDDVSRLAVTVGVSYDADVQLATRLLLEIAKANPNVRTDPAPFVAFDEFADSTLNLVLRVYVSIEVRLRTKSELHHAILERFRAAGIEIAYPQRDLHLRSVSAELPPFRTSSEAAKPPGA